MQKLKVFKYIEIDGQDVPMESLTDEEKDRLRAAMEDKHRKERQANES